MSIKYVVCDQKKDSLQSTKVFDTIDEANKFIHNISFCASEEATWECAKMYYIQEVEVA